MPTAKVHGFLMIFPVRTCSLAEVSCESLVNACHSIGRSAAEKILWNWERAPAGSHLSGGGVPGNRRRGKFFRPAITEDKR